MYISLYVDVNTFIGGRQPQNKLMRLRTFKKKKKKKSDWQHCTLRYCMQHCPSQRKDARPSPCPHTPIALVWYIVNCTLSLMCHVHALRVPLPRGPHGPWECISYGMAGRYAELSGTPLCTPQAACEP